MEQKFYRSNSKTTLFFSNKGQSIAFAPKMKMKLWEDDYVKNLVNKEKLYEVPEVEEKKNDARTSGKDNKNKGGGKDNKGDKGEQSL